MNQKENIIQLPKGWKKVKVGEYVISVKGKKPKRISKEKTKECSIPYVNIKVFEKNIIDEYTDGYGCALCDDGDFLMVWDGSRSGYVGKAIKGALGSTLVKLNFPDIENNYAYYFLQSKYLDINTRAKGVGIPHVDPNILWNYDLLIPPQPTQQAIVSKIEELFSELDKGIENLRTAQQQLKTYRQAVLKWAFEGKLTNVNVKEGELPEGWKIINMGDVIEKPKYGTSKKCEYEIKGIGVLRIPNIVKGIVNSDDLKFAKFDEQEIETYRLKEGDILTIRSNGSVDIVGKCALITKKDEGFLYAGYLIRLRPLQELILPKYLINILSSINLRNQIEGKAKSTSGVNNINSEELAGLLISFPPIEEQDIIIQEIESRLNVADKMEESITQSLQKAEALKQSILKKAFEGKLITEAAETQPSKAEDNKSVISKAGAIVVKMPQEAFPIRKTAITETDLHAGIIAMVIEEHQRNPKHLAKLSHIKCEKIADQVERNIGISLGRTAVKDAAGPDDYPHLKRVEHRATMAGYFKPIPLPIGHTYKPLGSMQKIIAKSKEALTEKELEQINNLIKTFLPFELEHAELTATLFAGWNNLLLSGLTPSDEEIVYESRENWSERKLTIEREKFFKTLEWMKQHNFIPQGKGKMVLKSGRSKTNKKKMKK